MASPPTNCEARPALRIRPAHADDAAGIAALYNRYVAESVVTFELAPVSAGEMHSRIDAVSGAGLPWLVAETQDGGLIGYAYATPWRARAGYRHSVESSVYLAPGATGRGHGRALYGALLDALRGRDVHAVIGGVALPNAASVRLHEAFGFEQVAHFRRVGRKFGRWIDVGYWQLSLPCERPGDALRA